jgi:mannose-6-phosphate isomerase-like protein (cupin superfamily)
MSHGLVRPGEGDSFRYAGQRLRVLAGGDGRQGGFAAAEVVVPAGFGGPVPHAHQTFDEALYVLDGELLVLDARGEWVEAPAGSMFTAPRGVRHGFRNPGAEPVRVLGLWSPAGAGLAFMRDVGAVLRADGPPDRDAIAAVYARHASPLLP